MCRIDKELPCIWLTHCVETMGHAHFPYSVSSAFQFCFQVFQIIFIILWFVVYDRLNHLTVFRL